MRPDVAPPSCDHLTEVQLPSVKFANLRATPGECRDPTGQVVYTSLELEIFGTSQESCVGTIAVSKLPPEGAAKLLKILENTRQLQAWLFRDSGGNASGSEPSAEAGQAISPDQLKNFLREAKKMRGSVFSDELGIDNYSILRTYERILEAVERKEISRNYYCWEDSEWRELDPISLVEEVRDEHSLVWIAVETPLTTSKAHDDKLDFIITNQLMPMGGQLTTILNEAWNLERGIHQDLRVAHPLAREHFEVGKLKVLVLLGKGFVLSVVDIDADPDLKSQLHKRLLEVSSSDSIDFDLELLDFGLEHNEEETRRLTEKAKQLRLALRRRGLSKSELSEYSEWVDELEDAAEYLVNQSKDYVEALEELVEKTKQKSNHNEKVRDALSWAKDVLENTQGLYDDSKQLREQIKEIREQRISWKEFLSATHGASLTVFWGGIGVALVFPQYALPIVIGSMVFSGAIQWWYQRDTGD